MTDTDVVLEFVADMVTPRDGGIVDANTSLFRDHLLDSMNLVTLVMFLEETFDVKVKAMDIAPENFDTVNDILAYVARKKATGA